MNISVYYKNEVESMCEYTADSVPRIGEKLYLQTGSSCDTYLVIEVTRAIINNEITELSMYPKMNHNAILFSSFI